MKTLLNKLQAIININNRIDSTREDINIIAEDAIKYIVEQRPGTLMGIYVRYMKSNTCYKTDCIAKIIKDDFESKLSIICEYVHAKNRLYERIKANERIEIVVQEIKENGLDDIQKDIAKINKLISDIERTMRTTGERPANHVTSKIVREYNRVVII